MKRIPLAFLSLCIAGCAAAADVALSPVTGEIVVPTGAVKSVAFAAGELNAILARAFGAPLPVVRTPTAGRLSVVLGDCAEARAAGIDVAALAHDAFTVKVTPTRVFIAGRDDPALDLKDRLANADRHGCTAGDGERATLFGVYAFLERHFGVRFYFPGDIGTIVPKASVVRLPIGCETKGPIFTVRSIYYNGDGAVPGETDRRRAAGWKALSGLRLRLQTQSVPCCHGQRGFSFPERFHKTHPEYFALVRRDGRLGPLGRDVRGLQGLSLGPARRVARHPPVPGAQCGRLEPQLRREVHRRHAAGRHAPVPMRELPAHLRQVVPELRDGPHLGQHRQACQPAEGGRVR